jgi:cytoskeletal protein RodZ
MSFILDAIRKAEKQRSEDAVPSLEAMVSERRRRSRNKRGGGLVWFGLAMVIIATVYLNRSQMTTWWQQTKDISQQTVQRVKESVGSVISFEPGESQKPDSNDSKNQSNASDGNQPQMSSGLSDSASASTESKLTDAQRTLLSQIEFSVISYSSDADKRFAMVGSQILREGDLLEGFPIARIQPDGVVIDVSGRAVLIRP